MIRRPRGYRHTGRPPEDTWLLLVWPPTSQTSRSHPGEDTYSRIYPEVMKIPDPTTAPMTREVVARRVSRLRSCGFSRLGFRSGSMGSHDLLERFGKMLVFFLEPRRDADAVGQAKSAERPHDNAPAQEPVIQLFHCVLRVQNNGHKVSMGFEVTDAEPVEQLIIEVQAQPVEPEGLLQELRVVHGRYPGCLGQMAWLEGERDLHQIPDQRFGGEAIADADSRQSIGFGEGAERDDVVQPVLHGIGKDRVMVGELEVGFVQDDQDALGGAFYEIPELPARNT